MREKDARMAHDIGDRDEGLYEIESVTVNPRGFRIPSPEEMEIIDLGRLAGFADMYGDRERRDAEMLKAGALGMRLSGSTKRDARAAWRDAYAKGRSDALDELADSMENERRAEEANERILSGAYWGPDWSDPMSVSEFYGGL